MRVYLEIFQDRKSDAENPDTIFYTVNSMVTSYCQTIFYQILFA